MVSVNTLFITIAFELFLGRNPGFNPFQGDITKKAARYGCFFSSEIYEGVVLIALYSSGPNEELSYHIFHGPTQNLFFEKPSDRVLVFWTPSVR